MTLCEVIRPLMRAPLPTAVVVPAVLLVNAILKSGEYLHAEAIGFFLFAGIASLLLAYRAALTLVLPVMAAWTAARRPPPTIGVTWGALVGLISAWMFFRGTGEDVAVWLGYAMAGAACGWLYVKLIREKVLH